MKKKDIKGAEDRLIKAYEHMLAHVSQATNKKQLDEAIQHAKSTLLDVGQLTHEEVENIAQCFNRDIIDATLFLHETEEDLINWVKFDWQLIEARLWDNFSAVADKTLLEQQALQFRLMRGPVYKSSEIIGLGSLQCDQCGEILHFKKVSQIPPCPGCEATQFSRVSDKP
ncbi:MAG: zinc ribbon-containing protein [Gammaproteobacteria bacterium]